MNHTSQVTYSEPLDNKVSISCIRNNYTVIIYVNEQETHRTLEEEDITEYIYDTITFHFKKGTLDPADIIANPEKYSNFSGDIDKLKNNLIDAIQKHMDNVAIERGYDSIMSVITYADEPSVPRYQQEGLAARKWRSLCWAHGLQVLQDVLEGKRSIPSISELIAELPECEWPF